MVDQGLEDASLDVAEEGKAVYVEVPVGQIQVKADARRLDVEDSGGDQGAVVGVVNLVVITGIRGWSTVGESRECFHPHSPSSPGRGASGTPAVTADIRFIAACKSHSCRTGAATAR